MENNKNCRVIINIFFAKDIFLKYPKCGSNLRLGKVFLLHLILEVTIAVYYNRRKSHSFLDYLTPGAKLSGKIKIDLTKKDIESQR